MKKASLFDIIIATGFGAGFSPMAPGTAGAIVAVVIWWALSLALPFAWMVWLTALLIAVFTFLGIRAANAAETVWGKDPSRVVVDEMVGVWIPMLAVPEGEAQWGFILASFALFRLFDIWKPLGIRRMERFPGGVGVMMDDILAGVYSLAILIVARWWIG